MKRWYDGFTFSEIACKKTSVSYTTNTFGKLLYYGEEVDCADLSNALKKAETTGTSKKDILANAGKPSFMVVDMRKDFGMMVQLITPRAKRLHDAILRVAAGWDGKTDLLRKLG